MSLNSCYMLQNQSRSNSESRINSEVPDECDMSNQTSDKKTDEFYGEKLKFLTVFFKPFNQLTSSINYRGKTPSEFVLAGFKRRLQHV